MRPALPAAIVAVFVLAGCGRSAPEPAPESTAPVTSTPLSGAPDAADTIVAAAVEKARAEGKVVLIEFGASWCVWCTHFQTFIHAPDIAPIIERNFVVQTLTVKERDDKKALENPGGEAAMNRWGGEQSGLPFYVFLNSAGEQVGNSNAMKDGTNIGFPATPEEIERFVDLLARVAPKLDAADRQTVLAYLKDRAADRASAP